MKAQLTQYCNSCENTHQLTWGSPGVAATIVKDGIGWGFRCPTCYPQTKTERNPTATVPTEYILDNFFKVIATSDSFKPKGEHDAN